MRRAASVQRLLQGDIDIGSVVLEDSLTFAAFAAWEFADHARNLKPLRGRSPLRDNWRKFITLPNALSKSVWIFLSERVIKEKFNVSMLEAAQEVENHKLPCQVYLKLNNYSAK